MLRHRFSALLLALLIAGATLTGCTTFDSPPKMALVGLEDGILPNASAPLVLQFHEAIVEKTLSIKVIRFETDLEGNLPPDDQLDILYQIDGSTGDESDGQSVIYNQRTLFDISLLKTFPIGPQLAVIIEPGLADDAGNVWENRQIFKFGFTFECGGGGDMPTTMPSGHMLLLADISAPLSAQLQLLVDIQIDSATGNWVGQFTNADRNRGADCTQFGLTCLDEEEVCRTLPTPACVAPSQRAGTPAEYPDFGPNFTPPTGYTFFGRGCARDIGEGTFVFSNAPTDVVVQSPPITVKGLTFNLEASLNADGFLEGGGTFTAEQVFLGVVASGSGAGTGSLLQIPPDEVPPDVPSPTGEL